MDQEIEFEITLLKQDLGITKTAYDGMNILDKL